MIARNIISRRSIPKSEVYITSQAEINQAGVWCVSIRNGLHAIVTDNVARADERFYLNLRCRATDDTFRPINGGDIPSWRKNHARGARRSFASETPNSLCLKTARASP